MIWLLLDLVLIAAGAVVVLVDASRLPARFARQQRLVERRARLLAERAARRPEDVAWACQLAHHRRLEQTVEDAGVFTPDELLERLLDHRAAAGGSRS